MCFSKRSFHVSLYCLYIFLYNFQENNEKRQLSAINKFNQYSIYDVLLVFYSANAIFYEHKIGVSIRIEIIFTKLNRTNSFKC